MWRIEWHVQEERLRAIALFDEPFGLGSEKECGVAFLTHTFAVAIPVQATVALMREVIDSTVDMPVRVIESPGARQELFVGMAQVPLAGDRGLITSVVERLGHEPLRNRHPVLRPRAYHGVRNPESHRRPAGHQSGTRGRTDRKRIRPL